MEFTKIKLFGRLVDNTIVLNWNIPLLKNTEQIKYLYLAETLNECYFDQAKATACDIPLSKNSYTKKDYYNTISMYTTPNRMIYKVVYKHPEEKVSTFKIYAKFKLFCVNTGKLMTIYGKSNTVTV